jgi:hypothetical protein
LPLSRPATAVVERNAAAIPQTGLPKHAAVAASSTRVPIIGVCRKILPASLNRRVKK